MDNTLLFEAYVTLSAAERREFSRFVRSPFFNQRPALIDLADYLEGCCDRSEKPDAEAAWQAIAAATPRRSPAPRQVPAPGEKRSTDDDQRLRLANSALLGLLEHYWVYRERFADDARFKIRLAAAHRKRNLPRHFDITLREARKVCERQPGRTADYYHDLHRIEWEQYQWDSSVKRSDRFNLQATSDLMDTAFVARKLRLACLALSHQSVYKTDYDMGLLEPVLNYLTHSDLEQKPTIRLYFHCYHFLADPAAEAHFDRFRELLYTHADILPPEELRTLYLLAINFGIKKINEQQGAWLRTTFDLYAHALERHLLLENGHISRFAFNNIVAIALRLGELDWTEQFVQQHQSFLEKQHRRSTAALNLARVAYARRDYGTALLQLQQAADRDVFSNLQAKTLQLKIFYDTGEWETLESHLASMKIYIRRHARIAYQRDNYLRILLYTRLLMQADRTRPESLAQLQARIAAEPLLTEKDWLLEQASA